MDRSRVNHHRVILLTYNVPSILQRTGQRGGIVEDRIEEPLHVRRDWRSLSAEAKMRFGLLCSRVTATHGPWKYSLSAYALRKWIMQSLN